MNKSDATEKKVENIMQNREFSIEEGYQILICFLPEFWWNFLKGVMIEKGLITEGMTPSELDSASEEDKLKYSICDANEFYLCHIHADLGGVGYYLEDIIEERMHILPKQQHEGLKIKEDVLFQLIIDWCHYFNRNFKGSSQEYSPEEYLKDSLSFAVEWLEDMRKHPESHKKEWDIWNKIIEDVRQNIQKGSNSTFNTHITGMNL